MKTVLSEFDWNMIKINDVFKVNSGPAGTKIKHGAQTEFYQIGLKLSGDTKIFYDGKEIDFCSGTVLYIPKETRTDIDYRKTIMSSGQSMCIFFDSVGSLPPEPILIKCGSSQINNVFEELNDVFNRVDAEFFEYIGFFYNILSMLNKILKDKSMPKTDTMLEAANFMKEHLMDSYIDIKSFAQKFNISYDLLRHKFKKTYNLSPLQYYHLLKTNYIKSLIRKNEYSLNEISEMTGFSDFNYFSRFFKKNAGTALTEYKKQIGIC